MRTFNRFRGVSAAGPLGRFRSPSRQVHRRSFGEASGVLVASMLFQTNLFALVLSDNPRKVVLWDDYRKKAVRELRSLSHCDECFGVVGGCLGFVQGFV